MLYGQIGGVAPFNKDQVNKVDYAVYIEAGMCIETGTRMNRLENYRSITENNIRTCVKKRFCIRDWGVDVCARDYPSHSPHSSTFPEVPWISSLSINLCTSSNLDLTDPEHSTQLLPSSSVTEII